MPYFNINSQDVFGNTGLHIAAMKNQFEMAAQLIQRGISAKLRNRKSQTASDVAGKNSKMQEVLGYSPFSVQKHENYLMKKSKLLGYEKVYVVLNKGYLYTYDKKYKI